VRSLVTLTTLFLLLLVAVGCGEKRTPSRETVGGITVSKRDDARLSVLDLEVTKLAIDKWKLTPPRIGEKSYYVCEEFAGPPGGTRTTLYELTEVSVLVSPDYLDDADTANGKEWKGLISMGYSLVRSYNPPNDRTWTEWHTIFQSAFHPDYIRAEKVNGKWTLFGGDYKTVDPSDFPK
jgi:hypothetical protein